MKRAKYDERGRDKNGVMKPAGRPQWMPAYGALLKGTKTRHRRGHGANLYEQKVLDFTPNVNPPNIPKLLIPIMTGVPVTN